MAESISQEEGSEESSTGYPGQDPDFGKRIGHNAVQDGKNAYNTARSASSVARKSSSAARAAIATAQTASSMAQAAAQMMAQAAARAAAWFTAQAAATAIGAIFGVSAGTVILIVIVIAVLIIALKTIGILGVSTISMQITQSGPIQANVGDKIDYIISVNYPDTTQDIIITNQIPQGAKYFYAPQASYDAANNTVTWNINTQTASKSTSLDGNINTTLSLTLLATKDNGYIINIPKGKLPNKTLGESNSPSSPILVTPTIFQTTTSQIFNEGDYMRANKEVTPTLFQNATMQPPPDYESIISSCFVTKIGNPVIGLSLPPECQ